MVLPPRRNEAGHAVFLASEERLFPEVKFIIENPKSCFGVDSIDKLVIVPHSRLTDTDYWTNPDKRKSIQAHRLGFDPEQDPMYSIEVYFSEDKSKK